MVEVYTLTYHEKTEMHIAIKDAREILRRNRRKTKYMIAVHNTEKYGAHMHIVTERPIDLEYIEEKVNIKRQYAQPEVVDEFLKRSTCQDYIVKSRRWPAKTNSNNQVSTRRRQRYLPYGENRGLRHRRDC